jgi:hypothetical protein
VVKQEFFKRGSFTVGDGASTCFWEDIWLGETPLTTQYSSLYSILRPKNVMLVDVMSHSPLNIEFRRSFSDNNWASWLNLPQRLMCVSLTDQLDKF